jgi:hypothetical protein
MADYVEKLPYKPFVIGLAAGGAPVLVNMVTDGALPRPIVVISGLVMVGSGGVIAFKVYEEGIWGFLAKEAWQCSSPGIAWAAFTHEDTSCYDSKKHYSTWDKIKMASGLGWFT